MTVSPKTQKALGAVCLGVACLGQAVWAQPAGREPSRGPVPAAVLDPRDDRIGRRAIRGGAVDLSRESAELRELRVLEEQWFPRAQGPAGAGRAGVSGPALPGVELPADGLHSQPNAREKQPPPALGSAPWLQALQLLDNLGLSPTFVRFESHVIRYLEFYKEDRRGRSIMSSWLRKQGRYRALIDQTLARHHLPSFLLYIAMIESGYDPHDRSHKGAVGLWQFMPEGAKIYGLRVDYWVDERKDPVRSTDAAARYLGDLHARFGSWHLSLAAFNAGYGAVLRAMQKYNTNDYWELCRHEDGLPWETLNYVPKAIATAVVGENRGFFGYEAVQPERSLDFDTLAVRSSLSLDRVARVVSSTPEELTLLNPELRRGRVPPMVAGESWTLRVPPGTAETLRSQEDALRRAEPVVPYVLRFGERIEDLARDRGVSPYVLKRMNGIDDSTEVRQGLTLLVPPLSQSRPSSGAVSPPEDLILVAVPDKNLRVPGRKRVFYRTIQGDTLWAIAKFFGIKVADLLRWNALDPEATLATKLVLELWVDPQLDLGQAVTLDPALIKVVTTGSDEFFEIVETQRGRKRVFHTVKEGETWEKLAKRYGLTIADLERINRSGRQTELQPGQRVTVYVNMTSDEKSQALARLRGDTSPASAPPQVETQRLPDIAPEPAPGTEGPSDASAPGDAGTPPTSSPDGADLGEAPDGGTSPLDMPH